MLEKKRTYNFDTFGPFQLPLETNTVLASRAFKDFWLEIEQSHPGLPDAIGCYVFAIRTPSTTLPWYVGKTEKTSLRFESLQSHKLRLYESALREQANGVPLLYLLPRLTPRGKFRKVWVNGSVSIDNLERMLIGSALSVNKELRNTRSLKHLTQTVVPGYVNDQGLRTPDAEAFAKLLNIGGSRVTARTTGQGSLSEIAGDTLAATIHSLQASLGANCSKVKEAQAIFTYKTQDYKVSLETVVQVELALSRKTTHKKKS